MVVAVIFLILIVLSAVLILYKIYTRKRTRFEEMEFGVGSTKEGGFEEVANGQSTVRGQPGESMTENGKAKEESGDLKEETRDQAEGPQIEEKQDGEQLREEIETSEDAERESRGSEGSHEDGDLWITEEEQQKVDRKGRRSEEKARNGEEDASAKREGEKRTLDPEKRGGRPRESTQEPGKQKMHETKSRRLKPEVVCWKRERHWILALEMPDELLGKPTLSVLQNESPLIEDATEEGSWRLNEPFGHVEVHWGEGETDEKIEIALRQDGYLLFKLSGQDRGRCVKNPSFGSYLVVVPESLERDETLSGPPPAYPEPTSITGYCGHYFDLERSSGNRIGFQRPGKTPVLINPNLPRFELVGTRLDDASHDMGSLFGEKPPQIRALDKQALKDIETIVVGEEGLGKGRWRKAFSPVLEQIEQDLPLEFAAREGGWYFLRFYDANDDLLESLDFRFVDGLKGIKVPQLSPLPLEAGHAAVSVELFHESGCCVQPADGRGGTVQVEHEDVKTILTIPPNHTFDKTRWLVGPEAGPKVEVTILVERLWWAVEEESNTPSEWEDQLLTIPRDDFAATSKKALWLKLPRCRWVDRILVGFDRSGARNYPIKVMEETVVIPFRDFGDFKEVGDRSQKHSIKIWIKRDDRFIEAVIAVIPTEVRETSAERPHLNLSMLSAPRLASVLTDLRRVTRGPLRLLIKEVRQKYPGGRSARRAESTEFVKQALCVIAFSLELVGEEQRQILGLKRRWTVKARLARDEFPEVISKLRNRYEELKLRYARACHMRNGS